MNSFKSLKMSLWALVFFVPFMVDAQATIPKVDSPAAVISMYEERDLELFHACDHMRPGIFVSKLDSTYTVFGHKRLLHHLKNPTTDIPLLKKRQKQLKLLVDRPVMLKKVIGLLQDIKANQEGLIDIATEQDPVVASSLNNFYFSNTNLTRFNNSAFALDARNYTKYLGLFGPVLEHVVLHLALAHVQDALGGHDHCDHDHGHGHHDHFCIDSLHADHGASDLVKGGVLLLKAGHLGLHVASMKEMVDQIAAERTVVNHIHTKVVKAQRCIRNIRTLCEELKKHGYQSEVFGQEEGMLEFFNEQHSEHKDIFEFANDDAFAARGDAISFFGPIGATLAYSRSLKKSAQIVETLTTFLGDIDALVSMAQWYKKANAHVMRVSFVDYVTASATPELYMGNLWHIALDHTSVVENTVHLSETETRNIIITGPNKAGKSSILKAVGLNIILAQTFGVAAAASVRMTPFEKLISYIQVVDDITRDTSMMMAEMMRADNCMRTLHSLEQGQFACVLVDDSLFKGTTVQKSQELAQEFITAVGHTPQSCSVVATHMPALTALEYTHKETFKNYCIDLEVDEHGKAHSTFRLRKGVADQNRVFDIIQAEIEATA